VNVSKGLGGLELSEAIGLWVGNRQLPIGDMRVERSEISACEDLDFTAEFHPVAMVELRKVVRHNLQAAMVSVLSACRSKQAAVQTTSSPIRSLATRRRTVLVPIAHDLVHAATVHAARQSSHLSLMMIPHDPTRQFFLCIQANVETQMPPSGSRRESMKHKDHRQYPQAQRKFLQ
jgi:hypothetical protein